jgi:uncharacterized protein (TIGR03437 family)
MKYIWMAFLLAAALEAQTPVVAAGGVLNGASFARNQGVAPGSLVSIFGSELAAALAQNDTVPLSRKLSDVSVTFNDIPAGLYFVAPGQINAQIPWDVMPAGTASGQITLVVNRNGVKAQASVDFLSIAPGIFYLPDAGGWAIAINSDGSLAAPSGAIAGVATHPAASGSGVALLATGLGAVDSPIANGADSLDKLRNALVKPLVLVGGKSATVDFAGLSPQFPGVNQVNFSIPSGLGAATVPLQLQSGGITTSDAVKIAVQ